MTLVVCENRNERERDNGRREIHCCLNLCSFVYVYLWLSKQRFSTNKLNIELYFLHLYVFRETRGRHY